MRTQQMGFLSSKDHGCSEPRYIVIILLCLLLGIAQTSSILLNNDGSDLRMAGFKSCLHHSSQSWAGYLNSLSLAFLICKNRVVMVPTI